MRLLPVFSLVRFAIAAGIFLSGVVGFAASFKVGTAGSWKLSSQSGDNAIYKNLQSDTNERIVLQVLPALASDRQLFSNLDLKKLTLVREKFLNRVGIGNYTALAVETAQAKDPRFKIYAQIDSIYRDFSNHDVQMIERQFVGNGKMYVISYMMDGRAINDRKRANRVLDYFQPLWNTVNQSQIEFDRLPLVPGGCKSLIATGLQYFSNEAYAGELAPALRAAALSWHESSNTSSLVSSEYEREMSDDEIAQNCKDVPPEKRRKASDDSFQGQIGTFINMPGSCLVGVAQGAWDMAKGAVGAAREILVIQAQMLKLMYDGEYRSEVISSAGMIASEVNKAPKDFAMRMGKVLVDEIKKYAGETFPCLKPAEQAKAICNFASNLLVGGYLAKVLTKVPLAAEEASKVAKLAGDALKGMPGAKIERAVATSPESLGKDIESGLTKEAIAAKTEFERKAKLPEKYDLTPHEDKGQPILFGQKGVSPSFSSKGAFKGADINDVVAKLKSGQLNPNDLPVQYIWVNGQKVVVNNRSLTALSKAGLRPTKEIDMTGKLRHCSPVPPSIPDCLEDVLQRLEEMNGRPSSSSHIRSGDGWNAPTRETIVLPY